MKEKTAYHHPVLLKEAVAGLAIVAEGTYVDVTFGGGGHSKAILQQLGPEGRLLAFDQDSDALKNAIDDARFQLIHGNFKHLKRFLKFYGIAKVDGILGDFGVSSHQFDEAARGFSTRFNAQLDMRMDQNTALSAKEVINTYSEASLANMLFTYGELRSAKGMASAMVNHRSQRPLRTTEDLKRAIARFLPRGKENRTLAQVYQAIRIEVNQEMDALKDFLLQVPEVLKDKGRLSVISYHSLEDRLVKRFIREGKFEGVAEKDFYGNVQVPLRKVGSLITPSPEELTSNNRARSAKLRIAVKNESPAQKK
ncbi:MAG: 16S rRNA (cytosine(1402)-N(4))-methyltransferase RsmH [Bacteroidota bacterium]